MYNFGVLIIYYEVIKILFSSIIISNNKYVLILKKGDKWTIPSKILNLKEVNIDIICKEIQEIIGIKLTSKECVLIKNINEFKENKKKELDFHKCYLFNIEENDIIILKKESGFCDGKWVQLKDIDYYLKNNDMKNYIKKIEKITSV
ncbi:hypothetical protein [Clostridium tarantellae]|uniref:Nudix hydrolase domain-containing protein n=1 Tax=Clostridium tarantellae TaxID=39493 RepID=A0A6I1MM53_9CLOT|nr:hypothetical protein [Clostridium tarantellae]MPQ44070.1 hypothetical protein [Clostridium tarantellae]